MAEEKRADVVFVIDASDSMKPCFDKLRSSLKSFIQPFREEGFDSLRLGLLAYKAAPNNGKWAYFHSCVNGDDPNNMKILYGDDEDAKNALFTREGDPDVDGFCRRLDSITCSADENSPLALDCAADFPFEPLCSARRVIVMFTDEKFETGVLKNEPIGRNCSVLERVMNKIVKRHITLYLFAPECEATDMMGEFSRIHIRNVPAYVEGQSGRTDTWDNIDFEKVLEGIGRSVSGLVLQVVEEGPCDKAVYCQDKWKLTDWGAAESGGGVIDITNVKEGCALDMSEPLTWLNAKLHWRTPVDLDLHAFVRLTNGSCHEVSFSDRDDGFMSLDNDAGIGNVLDRPEGNEENIRCRSLNGIDRILFATKIFNEEGCFSDYNGSVEVTTSNPRQPMINVNMQSYENKTWCVIAMLDNSDPRAPRVFPINQVMSDDPDVNDPRWRNVGR